MQEANVDNLGNDGNGHHRIGEQELTNKEIWSS